MHVFRIHKRTAGLTSCASMPSAFERKIDQQDDKSTASTQSVRLQCMERLEVISPQRGQDLIAQDKRSAVLGHADQVHSYPDGVASHLIEKFDRSIGNELRTCDRFD